MNDDTSQDSVEYYPDAEEFRIQDGEFNAVAGSAFLGPSFHPALQQTPRAKTHTAYFPRAKGFTISGGNFMSIGGNLYDSRPSKVAQDEAAHVADQQHHSNLPDCPNNHCDRFNNRQVFPSQGQQATIPRNAHAFHGEPEQLKGRMQTNKAITPEAQNVQKLKSIYNRPLRGESHRQTTVEENPSRQFTNPLPQNIGGYCNLPLTLSSTSDNAPPTLPLAHRRQQATSENVDLATEKNSDE